MRIPALWILIVIFTGGSPVWAEESWHHHDERELDLIQQGQEDEDAEAAAVDPTQRASERSDGSLPGYRDFEPQPPVLSDEQLQEVEREVLRRCGLDGATPARQAPWYFHYELGLELARRGDPQRALDALLEATERREASKRGARMYGMWFTDYLPYFQIARLHVVLGNWSCAADALRRSEEEGEVSPETREYPELLELLDEVRAQTGIRDS